MPCRAYKIPLRRQTPFNQSPRTIAMKYNSYLNLFFCSNWKAKTRLLRLVKDTDFEGHSSFTHEAFLDLLYLARKKKFKLYLSSQRQTISGFKKDFS